MALILSLRLYYSADKALLLVVLVAEKTTEVPRLESSEQGKIDGFHFGKRTKLYSLC
jgi:hypothetical protein